jgi:hypothetical protein
MIDISGILWLVSFSEKSLTRLAAHPVTHENSSWRFFEAIESWRWALEDLASKAQRPQRISKPWSIFEAVIHEPVAQPCP